jgi:hypothetical protein
MSEKRVQFNKIVKSQLPSYVQEEFPLIGEFLSQYYSGQEYQGAPVDLIQNIDSYIKLDSCGKITKSTTLVSDIDSFSGTILVENTEGFPANYGLIKIDEEIITYTSKTIFSFVNCVRGFSGITSFTDPSNSEDLIFSTSTAKDHSNNSIVENLNVLFLEEFLKKVKKQFLPGLQGKNLTNNLNQPQFIRQSKDFYSTRGTDESFKILFKSLYGEEVSVIKPRDYVISPSNASYKKTRDLIVQSVSGDPFELVNKTLFQDSFENISKAYAPVSNVERISVGILTNSYYKVSIDGSYTQNDGSAELLYGTLSIHPKTKIIGNVGAGQTFIDVDSTVGFPKIGTLSFSYNNGTTGILTYSDKTITQFLGISTNAIVTTILDKTDIDQDTYAYAAGAGTTDGIRIKIRSVLNQFKIPSNTKYQQSGSLIKLKTLGKIANGIKENGWLFNTAQSYDVSSLSLVDSTNNTYRLTTKDVNIFRIGDGISLTNKNNDVLSNKFIVYDVFNSQTCLIRGTGITDTLSIARVTRNITKIDSNLHQNINKITPNVQNVYLKEDKILVASTSLPSFGEPLSPTGIKFGPKTQKITFSGTFNKDQEILTFANVIDHNFFTGDSIYYTPEKGSVLTTDVGGVPILQEYLISFLFNEGLYFVKRIDNKSIKLAKSISNIYNQIFVKVETDGGRNTSNTLTIKNNTIEKYEYRNKLIEPQKLLREISSPVNDGKTYETTVGYNGILVNGVEILNYKSKDIVYYGKINSIDVVSGGANYDIISPPILSISDSIGIGATGYCSVKGSFVDIKVLNTGFDYIEVPLIKISGGNGQGAKADAKLITIPHEVSFNASGIGTAIGIGSTNSSIGFSTYHKFRNTERVVYKTFGRSALVGLDTGAIYHVSVKNDYNIKLHKTLNDAVLGINTVTFTDYGSGVHALSSLNGKAILNSIIITDSGVGYENKKRTCGVSGINTALGVVSIQNHDYKTGEIIKYSVDGTSIVGLSTLLEYYVTSINQNSFKLSAVGVGTTVKDFYFKTGQYENLTSVGLGTHTFNYSDISVQVIGKVGLSSISEETFKAIVQPIVRGEITSIHLSNNGVGYGASEVLNFERYPSINLYSGSNAQLTPIISQGKIVSIAINSGGNSYNASPQLSISGTGIGAVLTPEITNGVITSVKINNGGVGYGVSTTFITVKPAGVGAEFKTSLQTWRVNQFGKNYNNLTEDDTFISKPTNIDFGLQSSYVYAPRALRRVLYATDADGNTLYGKKDLTLLNGQEITNSDHSPIIGWSYDGYPIYGPYGYTTKSGGTVSQLKSGYISDLKSNRPPTSVFPPEFFVEDFTWIDSSDETVLDENNGRFCVTPEFPHGTYAYFATFDPVPSSDGLFKNYKKPSFPYLIGNSFNSKPSEFNTKKSSNQNDYDLNNSDWIRNVYPYSLDKKYSGYEYVNQSYKYVNQNSIIKFVENGSVDSIGILTGGRKYQVNDKVVFSNNATKGFSASAKVSRLSGVGVGTISVANTKLLNVEFYPLNGNGNFVGVYTAPHNLKVNDTVIVSGVSTTSSLIEGIYSVGVTTNILNLSTGVSTTGVTGIVTYFSISSNLSSLNIRENDILGIGTEKIQVLNIDRLSSRIRVLRQVEGSVSAAHTATTSIKELPRKFTINVGYKTTFDDKINKEYYFDPKESVGLGTNVGVGIGITLFFANPGAGITQIFIPTRSIYLENHKLTTGDEITYQINGGSTIGVATVGGGTTHNLINNTTLYVAKLSNDLIGLSTVRVGLGTTGTFVGIGSTTSHQGLLHFVGLGTGTHHSFKISYPNVIKSNIEKNVVTVATAATHGLLLGDNIEISVNPSISTSVTFKYNLPNRKLLSTDLSFTAAGVGTTSNSIYLNSHGLITGQKIIHNSSSPAGGLQNDKEYFVYVVDTDNIKLTNNKFEVKKSIPNFVDISTQSSGTISPVNPPLTFYRNSTISFNLNDSSLSYTQSSTKYPGFILEFYRDYLFTQRYETSGIESTFDISQTGIIGVTPDAKVNFKVNENTPNILYYKLVPIRTSDNLLGNKEIVVDDSVDLNNQIIIKNSNYSGKFTVSNYTQNTFSYNLNKYPESSSYDSTQSQLSYTTNSFNSFGSIASIKISDKGKGYSKVPGITTVTSTYGTGAILEASSETIGKIKTTKIENIGFDYSSDLTLKPGASIPQVLKIEPLTGFDYIGISSFGIGYTISPRLVVLDGKTKNLIDDVDLQYVLGKDKVEIIKNSFKLSNTLPTILPVENPNGIRVSTLSYNTSTKEVTAVMKTQYSDSFPLSVNDKILVEGASVGVGSTGRGYNSSSYNYSLFTITKIHPNLGGGVGIVTYSMSDYVNAGEYPGNFDTQTSSATLVPEKYFPQFNPILKVNEFFKSDEVTDGKSSGIVFDWDRDNNYLVVETIDTFVTGKIINSPQTGAAGLISEVVSFTSNYDLDYYSIVENGWEYSTGFLNNELQRIHDNDYYQNFSYSIKSKVPYEEWNDAVSSLNHTSGFKKFGNLQVESQLPLLSANSLTLRPTGTTTTIVDLISSYDLNCVPNFDLVSETYLTNNTLAFSDEIIFKTRILTDYAESISNRVLTIDDISGEFNNNPRTTPFTEVFRKRLEDGRAQKFIVYVRDRLYNRERQIMIVSVLNDIGRGVSMINQYGRVESVLDLGSFDYVIDGAEGVLLFYPVKYTLNNYNVVPLAYNIDTLDMGTTNLASIGSTTIGVSGASGFPGALVSIATSSILANGAIAQTMVTLAGVGTTSSGTRSAKILVNIEANDGRCEYEELNLIHDGTKIEMLEYGQLSVHSSDAFSSSGLGTYHPYFSGSNIKIDYTPAVGIVTAKLNTVVVAISSEAYTGLGTFAMSYGELTAKSTTIGSATTVGVASYFNDYDAAYCLVQVSDTTNNKHQLCEIIILDDNNEIYLTEYGNIETSSGLGTFGGRRTGDTTELTFTPSTTNNFHVKTLTHALRITENVSGQAYKDFNNASIDSGFVVYTGTESTIKKDFNLTHKTNPIFKRVFDGSDNTIISIADNSLILPNHFFVSGEEVSYAPQTGITTNCVGIATTTITGFGSTDKLPSSVYVIKISESKIKFAATAENALKRIPVPLDIISVGIGTSHSLTSKNQNQKVLISIDNAIQSPIVGTSITTSLDRELLVTEDIAYFVGITSFFGADYVQIDTEIMKILGVGIGSTNAIKVARSWLGTALAGHSTGAKVTKIDGNYNIVDNIINFIEAPYGNNPIGTITDPPQYRDWIGISTSSSFNGRVFTRSGVQDGTNESYARNYLFDDISQKFTGQEKNFRLTSNNSNVIGVATNNAIVLINGIFQGPELAYDYTLNEASGITTISFTGTASSVAYDPNNANIPVGGVIVSVGSTEGFGYQPLIGAGGTAVVSAAGTISLVSIGNSGSGYRVGVQTVRVGVALSSRETPNIEFIGTAVVSNGHIVSIAVTNPGVGYTSTNPPYVVIDPPLSYVNIPLVYSSESSGGGGAQGKINIVVGQGSSVIDFEITNTGYGYGVGHILTVPIGGLTGIPTTSSANFKEFKTTILGVDKDSFSAWSIGQLQVLDDFSSLFNGNRKTFPISSNGNRFSIQARAGSNITIQDTLLIFINDILQVPGKSYTFTGGSSITFDEAPKSSDTVKFIFYKGTGGTDVVDVEIINTVKEGDDLTIEYANSLNQKSFLQQTARTVTEVVSSNSADTTVYYGPGLSEDSTLYRPVEWCRQTEDRIIDGRVINKSRELYEPLIAPSAYLIQSVGIGSTIVFVDNVRPFFNPTNENILNVGFQKEIVIVNNTDKVSAAATAIVSIAGTITSVKISGGGVGYSTNPEVNIQNPIGLGTTARALATTNISVGGTVSSVTITSPGIGYTGTNPPVVLISPPTFTKEDNTIVSYEGDFGIITGIGTTSVGTAVTGITFDLVIPQYSSLRNSDVTSYTTRSGIDTGYYFIVYNSNVGNGVTSLGENNSIVGVGTSFLDNIYRVVSVGAATTGAIGLGVTVVTRVTVSVSSFNGLTIPGLGYSDFYGEYSWGRLLLSERNKLQSYDAITTKGVVGIQTGPVVKRNKTLKFQNYLP